jgi:hypothetical protein
MRRSKRLYSYENPRKIPFSVRYRIVFEGPFIYMGIILILLALILYIDKPVNKYNTFSEQQNINIPYKARVTTVEITNTIPEDSDHPLVIVSYTYNFNSRQYSGKDYLTKVPRIGAQIDIRIVPNMPGISGIDRDEDYIDFGNITASIMLLLIGLAFVKIVLNKTTGTLFLLRYGYVTKGRLYKKRLVRGTTRNGTYELWFRYKIFNGKTYKTRLYTKKLRELSDDKEELLLYDPVYPAEARLLDALSVNVRNYITQFTSFFKYVDKSGIG